MVLAADQLPEQVRRLLQRGPHTARQLMAALQVSQPTVSRALRALGDQVLRIGAARSIQYTLRDPAREAVEMPIYQVSAEGQLRALGRLVPVRPEGFVMVQTDGTHLHSEGLPWWLDDMRPQGYLGRAFASQFGATLGLSARPNEWTDTHVLRALLHHGNDLPGNLLVGERARNTFINAPDPTPVALADKPARYADMAAAAARGEHVGSSAGGEQAKFTAYARGAGGDAHVIVKFSAASDNAVSQRWRDLLLAEHLALQVLREHGVPAAQAGVLDHDHQRFLEVLRFDRVGPRGRRGVFSLAALDAQFVGSAAPWPTAVRALAQQGIVQPQAVPATELLWAFGTLIGNTDMHKGNLAFMSGHGLPYALAPAYDMSPMAFAPTAGGDLPERSLRIDISAEVPDQAWLRALPIARDYLQRLDAAPLSPGFGTPLRALHAHVAEAERRILRLRDADGS